MHVLQVSMHTSPWAALGTGDGGGMNVVVSEQAAALAARGHRVTVATRRFDTTAPDVVEVAENITLHHLPAGPSTPLPKSQIDDHLDEFADHLARLPCPDVVHAHHWMSGVTAVRCARAWGVPLLTSFHSVAAPVGAELDAGEPPESPRRIPGERTCVQASDALVTISHAEGATLVERYAADPASIVVVPPGVDHDTFHPSEPTHLPPIEEPYLLFAARLQPLKGLDLVIRALALLEPAARPTLLVAGGASPDFADYGDEIDALVSRAGLTGVVEHVGSLARPEFARVMRGARALVVPSRSETFGLVALEAAASGTPTLASATGGLREAVADGVSGLLLRREPRVWADAIAAIVSDDESYARLSRGAREHAAGYTWQHTAELLEALYERLS